MKLKTRRLELQRQSDLDQQLFGQLVDFPQTLLLLLPHVKHLLRQQGEMLFEPVGHRGDDIRERHRLTWGSLNIRYL